ncbi:MAG: S8 family serine peptidase [bacterium]
MKTYIKIILLCLIILSILPYKINSVEGSNSIYNGTELLVRNGNQLISDSLMNSLNNSLFGSSGSNLSNIGLISNQGLLSNGFGAFGNLTFDPLAASMGVIPSPSQIVNNSSLMSPAINAQGPIAAATIISPAGQLTNAPLPNSPITNPSQIGMAGLMTPLNSMYSGPIIPNPVNTYIPGQNFMNGSLSPLGIMGSPILPASAFNSPLAMNQIGSFGSIGNNYLNMVCAPVNGFINAQMPNMISNNSGLLSQHNISNMPYTVTSNLNTPTFNNSIQSHSLFNLPANNLNQNNLAEPPDISSASFIAPPPIERESEGSNNLDLQQPQPGEFSISDSNVLRNLDFYHPQHTNELIVMFQPGSPLDLTNQIHNKCGTSLLRISPYAGFHLVKLQNNADINDIILQYNQEPLVLYAEPNFIRRAHLVPNDPYYPYQWHLPHLFTGWAWDINTGLGAVVALLDSGVSYRTSGLFAQAPDLGGTIFAPGFDFVNVDTFPDDDNSHGTFMCGCIAQTTNNLLGVAGVAFNATIMPVKIMDPLGDVTIANEVDGIYFAVNNGADIINLSLGGVGIVTTEQTAVDFAYNSGVVVLASSGNAGSSTLEYPASYDSCISVGATQYDDTIAPYSNYGTALDLVAPGGNLALDQNFDGWADGILQQTHDGTDFTTFRYYFQEGTSPACALASGVTALVVSKSTITLTPLQIKQILEGSAIDLGTVGWDQFYGSGKVNAYYALLDTP